MMLLMGCAFVSVHAQRVNPITPSDPVTKVPLPDAPSTLPISSGHNGPNDMVEASDGQVTTGTPQAPPKQPHHKHHLRNALIVFGACFAMALVIAVVSK
jgi:hypothetical protein